VTGEARRSTQLATQSLGSVLFCFVAAIVLKLEHRPSCAAALSRRRLCLVCVSLDVLLQRLCAVLAPTAPRATTVGGRAPRPPSTLIVCQLPAAASTFATVFNASCQWPAAASTLATSFNAVRTISSSSFASRRCVSSDACDWHACRCSSASSSAVLHSSDPKAF